MVRVHARGSGESAEDLGSLVGELFVGLWGELGLDVFMVDGCGWGRGGRRGGGSGSIREQ